MKLDSLPPCQIKWRAHSVSVMENNSDQNAQEQGETADTPAKGNGAAEPLAAVPTIDALAEAQQKYIYLYAEFENYKKRAQKERQETVKFALESAAGELVDVLDNLDRALQFAKPEGDPHLLEGLKMVMGQFKATLEKQGVKEIPTENRLFDPELHESVGQLPSEKPQGTIIQTPQKGYTLHGRLIRPARVIISSGEPS